MFRSGWKNLLLGIPAIETTFERRGFSQGSLQAKRRLEKVGQAFLHGYHSALNASAALTLESQIDILDSDLCGFAYEGAAMALAILDWLTPWQERRFQAFLKAAGSRHVYMAHVGFGWAAARLRRPLERLLPSFNNLMRWQVVDGYGFHEGYFHWKRCVGQREAPRVEGYARRAFDQGLGRSLWFIDGADTQRIPSTIAGFPVSRRADLWSGIGLACTYAGGVDGEAIQVLAAASENYRPQLAQGAAFAAKTRQLAGNPAAHTELACQIICNVSAENAAQITDDALMDLPGEDVQPAYEVWRHRIQTCCAELTGVAL
jgi:hypothetical protein